jgi:hypothetical protein
MSHKIARLAGVAVASITFTLGGAALSSGPTFASAHSNVPTVQSSSHQSLSALYDDDDDDDNWNNGDRDRRRSRAESESESRSRSRCG